MKTYRAVSKNGLGIIRVSAETTDQADHEIEHQLRFPGRAAFLAQWNEGGRKIECLDEIADREFDDAPFTTYTMMEIKNAIAFHLFPVAAETVKHINPNTNEPAPAGNYYYLFATGATADTVLKALDRCGYSAYATTEKREKIRAGINWHWVTAGTEAYFFAG